MARAPYTINFRFVGNAQSQTARRDTNVQRARDSRGRFTKLQEMMNTIVEDVALNTADRSFNRAKKSLEQGVEAAVAKEIQQMALMIGKFTIQPSSSFGPKGYIKAADTNVSAQAKSLWKDPRNIYGYELSKSDANWGQRTSRYLNWKRENGYSQDWWKLSGDLRKALSSESLYKDLGPIKVSFLKTGGTIKNAPKQTSSGRKGSVSSTYTVGQLNVQVMDRITPDMLPALMDRLGNGVNDATPHGSSFIPSLFRDKDTANKLLRFGQSGYRPVIEPFLAYYLTRAIPNAVFNRTEKLISDVGSRFTTANGRRSSLGAQAQGT